MAVRRETIILELEDNASAEALAAATAFKTLDKAIDGVGRNSVRTKAFQTMRRDVDNLGSSVDRASSSIDSFSGRLGLLGTAVTALGPALIPLTAAAIPAITTLTAGMGAAASAAGVLVLAFQGVGDAVTAVSDYRLEPTADNLAKVREEMEKLGPAGADFVMAIDRATPALRDLQMTARDGIFPGLERGLDELMTQLPGVRNLVADLSTTVGTLGEASANALVNDSDWQEFFASVGTDGASALENFGRATGNFVAGVANMMEALTDLGGGSSGMLAASQAFREWADNLEHTEGFKEFADYIRQSGPQVTEFLSATGEAMVALLKAAAPWGDVVLPALTAAAKAFSAIADSPIGPPLFAAAAGMLAVSKATALLGPGLARVNTGIAGARTSMGQLRDDLKTVAGGWVLASSAAEAESKKYTAAQGRLKALAGEAARTGPALAAMGLMATGASDKMGLTNTAMLTMAGSIAGPWGAALGAGAGLTMDLASANDDLAAAIKGANTAMAGGNLQQMNSELKTLRDTLKDTTESNDLGFEFGSFLGPLGGLANLATPGVSLKKVMADLSGDTDKAKEAIAELAAQKAGLEDLAVALGANRSSSEEMASGADRAQQAMTALGISSEDLAAAQRMGGVEFDLLTGRIRNWIQTADSTAGRTDAVGDAISQLGKDALGTAHSADALSNALAALIAPEQNLIAAQDELTSSIRHLGDDLDKQNKALEGNSDAAIKNRAAISDRVTDIQAMIQAEAEAGRGPEVVAQSLSKQRQALIDSATAAGLNKREVEALINQMNLTPDLVKTVFESAGIDENEQKARNLKDSYDRLPKAVRTEVEANGIPTSEAAISRLQKKYNLTPKQVRTLASLKDAASGPIGAVLAKLMNLDGKTATTTITTRYVTENIVITNQAAAVRKNMALNADGGFHVNGVKTFADGGWGADGRYYSRTPQIIPGGANILWGEKETGWEAYISGKPSERDRNLDILAMAADRLGAVVTPFASGGMPGRRRSDPVAAALWQGGHRVPNTSLITQMTIKQLTRLGKKFDDLSLKELNRFSKTLNRASDVQEKAVDRAKKSLDYWNDQRSQLKSDVTGSLKKDWFNSDTSVWSGTAAGGTAAYAQQQWKQQAKDSKRLAALIANLRKRGAGDAFITEILRSEDPLAAAEMFNAQTPAGTRQSQKLFLSATKATASAANSTSSIYADEQRRSTAQLQAANKKLTAINKAINKAHKEAESTRKKASAAKSVSKGKRAQTRSKKG